MPSNTNKWEIHPKTGIGYLKFGMSKSEVDSLSDLYGAVFSTGSDTIPDTILEDTLKQFGSELSEEEKKALIDAYVQNGPNPTSVTEVRGEHGLVLRYEADRLLEILLSQDQRAANFLAKLVFELSALDALVLFETANRSPGRYRSTEAAFDNIALSLDGFSVVNRGEAVRPLDKTDERFGRRSITLRCEPYAPANELSQFVGFSFLS